jgi:hypothetical protein
MGGTFLDGVYVFLLNDHENIRHFAAVVDFPGRIDGTLGADERKFRLTGGTIPQVEK